MYNFLLNNLLMFQTIVIDLFTITLIIKTVLIVMFFYVGCLIIVLIFIHIGSYGKFKWVGFKSELRDLTKFHTTFIWLIYSLIFIINHVLLFLNWDLHYIVILLIIINYLSINIIFHAFLTGIGNDVPVPGWGIEVLNFYFLVIFPVY